MESKENFSILIVDDDPTVVRILCSILRGFTPLRFATSGNDALSLARKSTPDLILLDVDMPDCSGFNVFKALKTDKALSNTPVIFISSHDSVELQTAGLNLGAVDFITKPPHAALVLARVRQQLGIKQLSDTLRGVVSVDFSTGTANRQNFEKALRREWQRAQRSALSLCVMLVQIDEFREYQLQVGENVAEDLLRQLAEALRGVVHRPTDVLARYASGTFAALLPDTDALGATTVARRAIRAIDMLPMWRDATKEAALTLYIGVASSHASGISSDAIAGTLDESSATLPEPTETLVAGAEESIRVARARKERIVADGVSANVANAESIA